MHYDLEVSGFPSSHAGHLVLLGLKDQDYPGTKRIEDWPTWDLPILKWAKRAGRGRRLRAFRLGPRGPRPPTLPNDEMPGVRRHRRERIHRRRDRAQRGGLHLHRGHAVAVGAEHLVSHAQCRIPHADQRRDRFPLHHRRAGRRSAAPTRSSIGLSYRGWTDAIERGAAYVSDGRTHLMNFAVNGTAVGTANSEVTLPASGGSAHVTISAAALLDATPDSRMSTRAWDEKPYWSVERARIGVSGDITVEVVVNGRVAAKTTTRADGQIRPLTFDVPIARSSLVAVRVPGAAHTNPMFVTVGGAPIRASRASAEWCLAAVNQCWTQKVKNIRDSERDEARRAYDHAREVYKALAAETSERLLPPDGPFGPEFWRRKFGASSPPSARCQPDVHEDRVVIRADRRARSAHCGPDVVGDQGVVDRQA